MCDVRGQSIFNSLSSNQIANARHSKMSWRTSETALLTFEIVVGTRILCENRFQSKLHDLDDERHTWNCVIAYHSSESERTFKQIS